MHADDSRVAEVQNVAGVLQLVVRLDGDDGVALLPEELSEVDAGAAQLVPESN